MNLSAGNNLAEFVAMLTACEESNMLDAWSRGFVNSLRDRFETRESAIDLGCNPWNPSMNQWNTLHGIWSAL